MSDITIVCTTLNKLPKKWQRFYKKMLLEAAQGAPIITLSKKPMDWGLNVIQTEPESLTNIYWQMLKGAKLAKTPYIGIAEDDTAYHKSHFKFRPPLDTTACNCNRWVIPTHRNTKFYFYKNRPANSVAIAPRKIFIEALEERFKKFPVFPCPIDPVDNLKEKRFGLKRRKYMKFCTVVPVINLYHAYSYNPAERHGHKTIHNVRAYDLPYWGNVNNFIKNYE